MNTIFFLALAAMVWVTSMWVIGSPESGLNKDIGDRIVCENVLVHRYEIERNQCLEKAEVMFGRDGNKIFCAEMQTLCKIK